MNTTGNAKAAKAAKGMVFFACFAGFAFKTS
jgi:hypothetical protein